MADPVLEAHQLARTFQTDAGPVRALREATLTVARGEMVSITGRSGSGKSTLLHLLGMMDEPSSGGLMLLGGDVSTIGTKRRDRLRASHLGFVFQAFHLIEHRSVAQNVAVPLIYTRTPRARRGGMVDDAISTVGLSHRAHAVPRTLSGGEKQRTALARAIVHRPDVVLCDEPTGNLDRANAEGVLALLRACTTTGAGVVVVTHDSAVSEVADTRYHMDDGTLRRVNEPSRNRRALTAHLADGPP